MEHSIYFAADEAEKAASYLEQRTKEWFKHITVNNYLGKIKKSWAAYHGNFYSSSHEISFGGEQGELVNLAVNHYGNLCTHMLNMVTGSRPSFQCRAINTDRKSKIQAELGNGLLEYYMREKRLERNIKNAVEYAIVLGSGFVKMEWNATKGEADEMLDIDPEEIASFDDEGNPLDEDGNILKPTPIYDGDVDFYTLSPFDVAFDPTKESPELQEWVVIRTFVNRYNLKEKYPEYADEIMKIATKDKEYSNNRISLTSYDKTEDIPVYELYHKRTEATAGKGRYMMYLSSDIVLEDTDMPYRDLPVYRIAPRNILGTPFGYTSMWDILPLQDALNSLYSTIMTNNNAFGVQNILNPQGNNIKVNQMEGGLNFLEYNANMGKPEPLQLTATAQETYNFLSMLEKVMETISGINSVARGNPESSLRSGTALALVQSQALQFMSGLQQSYIQLLEDVGTGLINILKDFADAPRMASIAGISNTTKMVEFKSEDLEAINRVVVDVGNALAQTPAGRAQIAENLLQMGLLTTPERYLEVLNTGNLKSVTQGMTDELDTITSENETLLKGGQVIAIATDHHAMHIREHRAVLADPILRQDADLVARTLAHIQEHISLLQTTDPNLLSIIGEQPLAPPGGSPINPQQQGGMPSAQGASQPLQGNPMAQAAPGMPSPPEAPAIDGQAQPSTPEELMAMNTGQGNF